MWRMSKRSGVDEGNEQAEWMWTYLNRIFICVCKKKILLCFCLVLMIM